MLAVRSIEVSTDKYLRNSIRAYFEGTRNLRWIIGVIGGAQAQARVIVETRCSQYAGNEKYRELMAHLQQ
jgi:hypothetical protein